MVLREPDKHGLRERRHRDRRYTRRAMRGRGINLGEVSFDFVKNVSRAVRL